jgi:RimJ/RimL family protein N-acetyltransferase
MGQDDAQALWELDQDPEVMRFLNGGKPNSIDDIHHVFLPRLAKFTQPSKGWGVWQVSEKSSNEYLGWILARPMDFFTDSPRVDDLEVGWRFFKKAWGHGYATEAVIAVKDAIVQQASIGENQIHFISATAVAENTASVRIMKKLGMRLVRKYRHVDDSIDVAAVYYQMAVNNK